MLGCFVGGGGERDKLGVLGDGIALCSGYPGQVVLCFVMWCFDQQAGCKRRQVPRGCVIRV